MTAVQLADGVWRIPTAPLDLVNSLPARGRRRLADPGRRRHQAAPRRRVLAALDQLGQAAPRTSATCCSATPTTTTPAAPRPSKTATGSRVLDPRARGGLPARGPDAARPTPPPAAGRLIARRAGRRLRGGRRRRDLRDGAVLPARPAASRSSTPRATRPGTARSCTRRAGCSSPATRCSTCAACATRSATPCTDVRLSRDVRGPARRARLRRRGVHARRARLDRRAARRCGRSSPGGPA